MHILNNIDAYVYSKTSYSTDEIDFHSYLQNTRVLSDFRARHHSQKPSETEKKEPCQPPELPKLDITQETRNINNQNVQSAPAVMPPHHLHSFKLALCFIDIYIHRYLHIHHFESKYDDIALFTSSSTALFDGKSLTEVSNMNFNLSII